MTPDVGHFSAPYAAAIRSDSDILSSIVRTADLSAPVAACPGWDVEQLIVHTGFIHRWATVVLETGAAPTKGSVSKPGPDDQLAVWIVDGATRLIELLADTEPDAPTWHPFPFEQTQRFWPRRQALETMMHRWDAQTSVGHQAALDAELSSEGIAEYFELGVPRILQREEIAPPAASLHVHCTDVDGEWLVWNDAGTYRMLPVHDKGDAAIRGAAADILLLLMGRADRGDDTNSIDIVGDRAAADSWLDLPGW